MLLRFAHHWLFFIVIPIYFLIILYKFWVYRFPVYRFPLASYLHEQGAINQSWHRIILNCLRAITLFLLLLLAARPQWVDEKSRINVEGIDICIALDVSGSMQLFDDPHDSASRIDVAKREAIRFIEKRKNDPIGIVIFGKECLSRCPTTLDKPILTDIVRSIELGMINPEGTFLGTGLATAINSLKNSKAKSRIIILMTDGIPTPPEKIEPDTAITLAKEFDIKVYTIGIGNPEGCYFKHPVYGLQPAETNFNQKLLEKIAHETGGQFFQARNPQEMRTIYNTIDKLETTEYETDIFHNYYEAFFSFIWIILGLIALELCLRLFFWGGI